MNSTEEMTLEEKLKCSLSYDQHTGCIHWKNLYNGREAFLTRDTNGYLRGRFLKKDLAAHRVAWLLYYGTWPKHQIDHIDGDRANNRIKNLRDVPQSENLKNRGVDRRNTTGVCGVRVYKQTGKYVAYIRLGGVSKHLGYFSTFEEAVEARQKAEKELGFHPNHGRR